MNNSHLAGLSGKRCKNPQPPGRRTHATNRTRWRDFQAVLAADHDRLRWTTSVESLTEDRNLRERGFPDQTPGFDDPCAPTGVGVDAKNTTAAAKIRAFIDEFLSSGART